MFLPDRVVRGRRVVVSSAEQRRTAAHRGLIEPAEPVDRRRVVLASLDRLGLLLVWLGLFYLWAFVAIRGVSDDISYRAALGMGALGVLAFLVALGRTVLPPLFFAWH